MKWQNKDFLRIATIILAISLIFSAFAVGMGSMYVKAGSGVEEEPQESGEPPEPMSPVKTTRSVLVELFGGTNCGPCIPVEMALEQLAGEYSRSEFSVLDSHIWDAGDKYETPASIARRNYYNNGLFYMPATAFDGMDWKIGNTDAYNEIKARIDSRLLEPSNMTVTVNGTLGVSQGTVNAKITAIDPVSQTNLVTRFIIYEDHNIWDAGHLIRYTVVDSMLEEPIPMIVKEQEINYTKTFTINPTWDRDKLGVTVFVQSDDKFGPIMYDGGSGPAYYWLAEILQSATLNLSATDQKVDLAVAPSDISFSDPSPNDGDSVTIYAEIHNVGTIDTPSDVMVGFFDGDPGAGGTQIGINQNAGIISGNGGTSIVQVNWDTTGEEGTHEIVVVADVGGTITEPENENNNIAPKTINVGPPMAAPPYAISRAPLGIDIPLDTDFVVAWNEVMDWDTVNSSFSYTDFITTWYASDGTFTHDPIARTSTFDPIADLTVGTLYNVTFDTTALDLDGMALDQDKDGTGGEVGQDELSWEFTTIADPAPTIISTDPVDDAAGILVDQNIVITFSEQIDTGTFIYSIIPDPGGWNWVWTGGDTVATGSHNNFDLCTGYELNVTAADDMAGNPLSLINPVPNPWNWTTECDTTSPQIVLTSPAHLDTGVPLNQNVMITFSEPINTGTFDFTISPDPGSWSWVWSGGDTVVTGSHANFTASTLYQFNVTAADDLAGNPLTSGPVDNPWNFTTGAAPDITPPEITATTPIDNTTGVLLDQNVVISFSEAIDKASFDYTISPDPSGWSWVWSAGDTIVTGTHTNFTVLTEYIFTVDTADDLAGNPLAPGSVPNPWNWTTESGPDTTPPEILSTTPVDNSSGVSLTQVVVITFSEEIDNTTFLFDCVPDPGSWAWTWSNGNSIATGTHMDFTASTDYVFNVTAADDMAGNPLAAGAVPNPWNWTTGTVDITPPEILSTTPINGTTDVAITQNVEITFTESIDPGTFTYTVSPNPLGWNWVWSAGDTIVTGTHPDFDYSTTYTFFVTGADDTAGNPLTDGVVPNPWTWTTRDPPDLTPPEIIATIPSNNAVDVALDQNVVITFSETIATSTFEFSITPDPGGWSWNWDLGNTRVTLTHNAFGYETPYTITVTAADDLAGNELTSGAVVNPWSWTTVSESPPVTTGYIAGTVTDKNFAPIADATVLLTNSANDLLASTTTDANGNYQFSGVEAAIDEYTVTASKEYYKNASEEFIDVTAEQTTDVDLVLDANATITGRVVHKNNPTAGVGGIEVTLLDQSGNVITTTTTDSGGNFECTELDYGTYKAYIDAPDFIVTMSSPVAVNKDNLNVPIPDIQLASKTQPTTESEPMDWIWILLLLVVIIVVILILVALMATRRKKPTEVAEAPEESEPEELPAEEIYE